MNRYDDRAWPFAEGGGPTITLATLIWATTIALWRARPSLFTRLLVVLATPFWLLILYFFRDPQRPIGAETEVVVSAADGEVVAVERELEGTYLQQEALRISVFLSIFDVHVQRIPVGGTVTQVERRAGKFLQAFRPEASTENEHIAMVIATPYGPVLVKQIAGIMARRCVNYMKPGDSVQQGQRFGLIRFGSRVDLFLPTGASPLVTTGARVQGGLTPVARLDQQEERNAQQ